MIIKLKANASKDKINELIKTFKTDGFNVDVSAGSTYTLLGIIGDTASIDEDSIKVLDIVDSIKRIQEPYKKVNRKLHPEDSVIDVSGVKIGGGNFAIIAGPCSIESEEQMLLIANEIKKSGANMLRGGAFKPRTSPYSFQGLGKKGVDILVNIKKKINLPIVTEIMDLSSLDLFGEVDLIQVGARNMQNFELLKKLGEIDKPILLKRGLSNTYEELLMSAEYILSRGNSKVILCERGIRTFERETRNTLDISAIPVLKALSHLPVIVDPSHAIGISKMVAPLAKAATAAGCDGLMIEVHNDPEHALSDGPQSMKPDEFSKLVKGVLKIKSIEDK